MVRLHVKKGEESQFLYDTHVEARVEDIIYDITIIYNGRLKVSRICYGNGLSYLAKKRGGRGIEKDDTSNSAAKENVRLSVESCILFRHCVDRCSRIIL